MSAPMLTRVCRISHVLCRSYAKGLRRRVVKVTTATEDDIRNFEISGTQIPNQHKKLRNQLGPGHSDNSFHSENVNVRQIHADHNVRGNRQKPTPDTSNLHAEKRHESSIASIRYEKLKEGDKKFGSVIMCTKSRKHREEKKEIMLEGRRLILDALKAGVTMKSLFFSGPDELKEIPGSLITSPVYKVVHRDMKMWSSTKTPAGLIGIFERPNQGEAMQEYDGSLPVTLVCDEIRDPGNMGTLVRTAAAVGCKRILVTTGSVDVWEPKVLRAGAGSHFRVPIINNISWEQINNYLPQDSKVFVADTRKPTEYRLSQITDVKKADKFLKENDNADISDTDDEYGDEEKLKRYSNAPLSVSFYNNADFRGEHIVLVMSGETSGVSLQARKLAFDRFGECIMIPMLAGVNSLNTAVAGSILLYEINRQIKQ